ncbi:MAG: L,D-transpeptidase [Nitrosomonas sp.]|jgi:hypothetical protein|nr:L,D-transpeptidase [Nitrosomonas sp.]
MKHHLQGLLAKMPSNLTVQVRLPSNRDQTGELSLIDPITQLPVFGPVPVLGRAAKNIAVAHGNPARTSTLPFGHTPLGSYSIVSILKNGTGTSRPENQYGKSGSIVLDPQSGDAAVAKRNGRVGLLIHGGRQANNPTPLPSHLISTSGCLRMLDGDLAKLIEAIKQNNFLFPGIITVEISTIGGVQATLDETIQDADPPPMDGGIVHP